MKVIEVANSMGGVPRHASFQALVRRIKLWFFECADAKNVVEETEAYGSYLLRELKKESLKSAGPYRRQRLVIETTEKQLKELEELLVYQDNSPSHNYCYSKVKCFFAALEVIQSVLLATPHVGFSRGWSLRDKIKSLNLPKNLFPQSLRPCESLAR
jgi:hypothetical protein